MPASIDRPEISSIEHVPAATTVAPLVEFKEAAAIPSIDEESVAEVVVISEPATMVYEIEDGSITQAEEALVDPPPPTDNPVQEAVVRRGIRRS